MKNKKYEHIIFDLDGTLTDSRPGIINAAVYALKKMSVKNPPLDKLNELIGIPLQDYFKEIFDFSDKEIETAVFHFREYYGKKGVFENEVYPGISELIRELFDDGRNLYVSTAKYEKYAKVVLDHFQFSPYLIDMVGADAGGLHATKTELASKIIKRNNISNLQKCVVVGDKHMDVEAGHQNDVDSIAVAYGFGTLKELQNSNPTFLAESVTLLKEILL